MVGLLQYSGFMRCSKSCDIYRLIVTFRRAALFLYATGQVDRRWET